MLKLANVAVRNIQYVKRSRFSTKRERKGIVGPKVPKRLEYSDYSFCFWISLPDQFQILIGGTVTKNGPFVSVPYILFAHDKEKGLPATKRQDLSVTIIM